MSSSSYSYPLYLFFYPSFNNVFQKLVSTLDVINPVCIPSFYFKYSFLFYCDPTQHFISQMIDATDLPQPSPVPHLRTSKVLVTCFPNCLNFSPAQSYAPNFAFHYWLPGTNNSKFLLTRNEEQDKFRHFCCSSVRSRFVFSLVYKYFKITGNSFAL
jgi:hypothetical protein